MFRIIILLFCLVFLVRCEGNKKSGDRNGRLISFNTLDDDIGINLEFSIPFISIPIKKGTNGDVELSSSLGLPSINVNPTSLAVGSVMLIGASVLVPYLLKSFAAHYPKNRYSKFLDNAEFEADAVLNFANQMLESRSFSSCTLRVACWSGQRAIPSDFLNMWSFARSNVLLSNVINSTAVEEAINSGSKGEDCMAYAPCPLRRHHMPILLNSFAAITNSYG